MGDISPEIFLNVFLYLSVPFGIGYAFRRLSISPIIGYIIAGIILGNFFTHLISSEVITNFASFGIVLLLFTIGLEVNLEKIGVLKKFIIAGGILQIGLTILTMALLSTFFHFTFLQAILIGIAFSSSSTSLVAKIVQERGEESSFTGELAMGMLMFQDLAFIPFIITFTVLQGNSGNPGEVVVSILRGVVEATVILAAMVYIGRRIVPYIFDRVVRSSRELLNLFIILFIFFIGFLSTMFHVPILIGMYVAGVLVSQTLEHYHIFSQIRPMRDILAIIFFIYIGSHITLSSVIGLLPSIIVFSVLAILLKFSLILIIFLYFKFSSRIAFSIAVFLFQVSENAFILMSLAYTNHLITKDQYLFIVSSVLISLIVTPLAINSKDIFYLRTRSFLKRYLPGIETFISNKIDFDRSPIDELSIKKHVVICGYGRIGGDIGRALMLADIPFIAVDYNYHTVVKGKREGIPILYGDPTDIDILDYAQVEEARVIVIVVPDKYAQEAIILNAKKLNPNIIIISRVHKSEHRQRMKDLGAHVVVQPELEASISIIKRLFVIKQVPKEEAMKKLRHFRVEQGA